MLVMSNLYSLDHGSLVMSPQRMFPTTPLVKLGDNHFAKVQVAQVVSWTIIYLLKIIKNYIIHNDRARWLIFADIKK